MTPDEIIQYICESVRTCFPPTFEIEFSEGQGGIRGVTTHVRVVARVATNRLLYDQQELLRLVEGELIEADRQFALIEGRVKGKRYQLRLDAEPSESRDGVLDCSRVKPGIDDAIQREHGSMLTPEILEHSGNILSAIGDEISNFRTGISRAANPSSEGDT